MRISRVERVNPVRLGLGAYVTREWAREAGRL